MDPDCERPSCISSPSGVQDFYKGSMKAEAFLKPSSKQPVTPLSECPLSRELLGHFTWSFLHTMSFSYPEHPNDKSKKDMKQFMNLFAEFYPCKICSTHFKVDLAENPPKLESRDTFAVWMCQIHNKTNQILGKPVYDCDIDRLKKRWFKNPDCQSGLRND